jgi:hypothetical protein
MSENDLKTLSSFTTWFKISSILLSCVAMLACYIYLSTMARIEGIMIDNSKQIVRIDRELFGVKRDVDNLLKQTSGWK